MSQPIDYRTWPIEPHPVKDLQLDPFNPRIPFNLQGKMSQTEIIHDLADHEDVLSISDNIVHVGYFSFEPLIGFKEKSKIIIVEGNRRLSASLLLLDPALAPAHKKAYFQNISKDIQPEKIKNVNVLIAPSRDAASLLIVNRHTNNLHKGWKTVMQACYFKSLLLAGKTIAMLPDELNMYEAELRNEIQSFYVYAYITGLKFHSDLKNKVNDSRNFPLSTLIRIYENPDGKKFLRLKFTSDGKLKNKPNDVGLIKIVSDLLSGTVDSRKLNKSTDIKNYNLPD